jgi:hypothetical protein
MGFTGEQLEALQEAILESFDSLQFEQLLKFRLDKTLAHISMARNFEMVVFDVMGRAEREGWTEQLLNALRQSRPARAEIFEIASAHGMGHIPEKTGLERLLRNEEAPLDVDAFIGRIAELTPRVCQIAYRMHEGTVFGTGFLVSPSRVMTNNHVVQPIVDKRAQPTDVMLTFDYRRATQGVEANAGLTCRLATEWLVDSSPHSPLDDNPNADPDEARPDDQLDYALLQLEGEPGSKPIGSNAEPGAPERGWIRISQEMPIPHPATTLFILQHPGSDPIKIAYGAVIGPNANRTRLRYRASTDKGSSGAPCFNSKLELAAIHHAGDPNFDALHNPEFNQGIPISAVLNLLEQRGKNP